MNNYGESFFSKKPKDLARIGDSNGEGSNPIVDGEIVDESQDGVEMRMVNMGALMNAERTIKKGEHWVVTSLMNSDINVNPGAKITIKGASMNSSIKVEEGGAVVVKGASMNSEIEIKNRGNVEIGGALMNSSVEIEKGGEFKFFGVNMSSNINNK